MSKLDGISFLHQFDLGNRDLVTPGQNILSITSTAAGDFNKSNMFEDSTRKIWRSVDVAEQEIIIQADLASQIDTFFVGGHNFTELAVIRLEANVDNNFVAPPFSKVIPVPKRGKNLVLAEDFGDQFEFYRLRILDPTNPCGFVEIGRIVGGRAFTMDGDEDIVDTFSVGRIDHSKKMPTEGFFRQSNEILVSRFLSASFSLLETVDGSNDNYEGLLDLFDNVKTTKPFLTIISRINPNFNSIWGQFVALPTDSFGIGQRASLPIRIEEVF